MSGNAQSPSSVRPDQASSAPSRDRSDDSAGSVGRHSPSRIDFRAYQIALQMFFCEFRLCIGQHLFERSRTALFSMVCHGPYSNKFFSPSPHAPTAESHVLRTPNFPSSGRSGSAYPARLGWEPAYGFRRLNLECRPGGAHESFHQQRAVPSHKEAAVTHGLQPLRRIGNRRVQPISDFSYGRKTLVHNRSRRDSRILWCLPEEWQPEWQIFAAASSAPALVLPAMNCLLEWLVASRLHSPWF